ncbi:MAG: hypothetical protein DWQ28_13090 [Proteobacteria bacterium]|nr:MAG: hypothetical protein DWQ28_13090 [Pseudomonadota bacterium]
MATITTRAGKGAALTHVELDANFTNLNTAKLESSDLAGYGKTFTQSGTPAAADSSEGNLWYKTDTENLYVYREVSSNVFNWVLLSTGTGNSDTLDGGSY